MESFPDRRRTITSFEDFNTVKENELLVEAIIIVLVVLSIVFNLIDLCIFLSRRY